jgi:MoxR-like ATPase
MNAPVHSLDANQDAFARLEALRANLNGALLGCEEAVEVVLAALLAHGHVLLQGAPGLGKTSLAKSLAQSISCRFNRLQFTPDLLPADVVGFSAYDQQSGAIRFRPGPVFANVLLADEVNRTTPRVQSALLEAMCESQVTVDGTTHAMADLFIVIATQNHLHASGTYPLPESQLDRFLVSVGMPRPSAAVQAQILEQSLQPKADAPLPPVIGKDDVLTLQACCREIKVAPPVLAYLAELAEATDSNGKFRFGLSTRGALALLRCSQACALLDGRSAVYPDDVKKMVPYVLGHRLQASTRSRKAAGVGELLADLLTTVPVP